ncbi:signal peptidase II [Candidatus Pelagibacter bacterium]|nr:signal peptidase II [Candidatus Pelagibacter bacterium]
MIDLKEIKNKIATKNNLYCLIVILIIFFLDRYTKLLILDNFSENTYYLNDFINLDLIWNIGIGFGFLSTDSFLIYNLITLLIGLVILILFYFLVLSEKIDKLIYSVIIGGALGNFYDRLVYNAVPDFIDLHYDNFHWFTFNVADIFITIGILIFILRSIFVKN